MKQRRCFALLSLLCMAPLTNSWGAAPALIPAPAKMVVAEGTFRLTRETSICANVGAEAEARKLIAALRAPTGLPLPVKASEPKPGAIVLELDRSLESQLGAEGYRLSVTPAHVTIRAAAEAGLFYGGVTFRQLLPAQAFATKRVTRAPDGGWVAPCIEIEDRPRFAWRGLLLDPARHFMPPEFVKKLVDAMALHKLNTLQLHLTDDQGWRIEIKKHPLLTKLGSVRKESPIHGDRKRGDGKRYGPFFYTQRQIRDLVAYAQARHVTLVPEIEMPGHFLAAMVAYPALSCRGGPFEVRTRWGIEPDILCPGNDAALAFVKDVLAEVCELFPSHFIHIGGDECPRDRWKTCPKCQARIRAENLQGEAQLQTWFNHRIEEFLASKGRRLLGWDEILEGGLTPGAAVMSWRGIKGGIAAASAGHDVVMAPTTHCYFDFAQSKGSGEPECIGGFVSLTRVYEFEPVPAELPESQRHHILGAQGALWTEYMWTPRDVEYFAFPRAAALAEVVWSPAERKDVAGFERRLQDHLPRLDQLGVNYRKPSAADEQK
ncbi:MAG: beta-N-acetylhexosaminidase [Verrucomicrobiia bacterium]